MPQQSSANQNNNQTNQENYNEKYPEKHEKLSFSAFEIWLKPKNLDPAAETFDTTTPAKISVSKTDQTVAKLDVKFLQEN